MILGIGRETGAFLYAVLSGVSVMAVYQVLRCFRKIVRHGRLLTGLEDLVFWISVSVYVFQGMYRTTYGTVRWFFVLGEVCGVCLCGIMISAAGKIFIKAKKKLEKSHKKR